MSKTIEFLVAALVFALPGAIVFRAGYNQGLAAQPPDQEYHYWQGYMDAKGWCETGIVFPSE